MKNTDHGANSLGTTAKTKLAKHFKKIQASGFEAAGEEVKDFDLVVQINTNILEQKLVEVGEKIPKIISSSDSGNCKLKIV